MLPCSHARKHMSVIIKTDYKNGARNIKESRAATNKSNFDEDKLIWEYIVKNPCSSLYTKYNLVNGRKDHTYNAVGDKITNHVIKYLQHEFNVYEANQVTKEMISCIAESLCVSDSKITAPFSRDASRQSVDELTQFATISKYIDEKFIWNKPKNGLYTLVNGNIIIADTKEKKSFVKSANARSIDFICSSENITIYTFAKYTEAAGSAQLHQLKETKHFIEEAILYTNTHTTDDFAYFYILIDGEWGESHIPELNDICKEYPNIQCGNCESLIDFINSFKDTYDKKN